METFETVLALLLAVIVVVTVARRIRVPYPILLVLGGLALGLVPGIPRVALPPELVLVLFLPPLLFIAGYLTPYRDFRANKRPIAFLAIGLPIFTTILVGVVAKTLIADLPWPAAFTLGAIVSPTDAIAATTIFRQLGVPRRVITVLEGESLVNDATALVAYRAAVAAAATGTFVLAEAAGQFVIAALGGIAIGALVAVAAAAIFDRLDDPPVEVALSLLIPFAAYLPAENLHLSSVLAAVVAGIYLGRRSARILSSDTRVLGGAAWEILAFVLNGFAFILIGLQLPEILGGLAARSPAELTVLAVVVSGTVIVSRLVWVFPATYLPRLIRAVRAGDPAPRPRVTFVVGWSGMRGVVSLAAALALPSGFPERELILFLTFAVILATLVGQGLTLPLILRFAGLADDGAAGREEATAREAGADAAMRELAKLRVAWPGHLPLIEQLEGGYRHRAQHLPGAEDTGEPDLDQELIEHQAIRRSVLAAERNAIIDLRDRAVISDEVMRRIERELDLEELRMEA
jgi:Na+/H+ antiporter